MMRWKDYCKMAWHNLLVQRRRTFYTMLGIAVGSMMLITLLSFGTGLQALVWENMQSEPYTRSIDVAGFPHFGTAEFAKDPTPLRDREYRKITHVELQAIKKLPQVEDVLHMVRTSTSKSYLGDNGVYQSGVWGWDVRETQIPRGALANPQMRQQLQEIRLTEYGRFFEPADAQKQVAVVGKDYLQALGVTDFAGVLGREIMLVCEYSQYSSLVGEEALTIPVQIIGVSNGEVLPGEQILLPLELAEMMVEYYRRDPAFNLLGFEETQVYVTSMEEVAGVAAKIREMGFGVTTSEPAIALSRKIYGVMQKILAIIGGIILFVASFGVVNTMMMATYERTHSIGVLQAVGASRKVIRRLFLVEAVMIGLGGWLFSLVVSMISVYVLDHFTRRLLERFAFVAEGGLAITFGVAMFALFLTLIVTVGAAIYPANRATRMNVVEVLGQE